MRSRVGILISGRGSNMVALAEAAEAADCPYEVVLVAANDPHAEGLARAQMMGIPTWGQSHKGLTREAFDALVTAQLEAHRVDHVALAGYMRLLSPGFVAHWRGRMVNIHPSLLPRHKGLNVHARAIAAGDVQSGCTVHLVTEELDSGDILAQATVPILPGDTPEALAARILVEEHRLYPDTLARFVAA